MLCFRELSIVRSNTEEPLVSELAAMTAQLAEARSRAEQANAAASEASSEARLAKLGCQWAEDRLAEMERYVDFASESQRRLIWDTLIYNASEWRCFPMCAWSGCRASKPNLHTHQSMLLTF